MEFSQNIEQMPYDLAVPLMGVYPNDFTPSASRRNTRTLASTCLLLRDWDPVLAWHCRQHCSKCACSCHTVAGLLSPFTRNRFLLIVLWKTMQRKKQWINIFKVLRRAVRAGEMAWWENCSLFGYKDQRLKPWPPQKKTGHGGMLL